MEGIVKTDEVEVKTVIVEIKAIKIGKKQMTQAVFKQLKVENIISNEIDLKGTPWGIINFTIKNGPKYGIGTQHIIWQKGNELRRCWNNSAHENRTFRKNLLLEYAPSQNFYFPFLTNSSKSYNENDLQESESILQKEVPEAYNKYVEKIEKLESILKELIELEQLFIAV